MRKILLSILASSFLFASQAMAQTAGKTSLEQLPEIEGAETPAPEPASAVKEKPSFSGPRMSYGLSAGTSFSNWGGASYLEPSARYQITDRFRGFASFTYMNVMPQQYSTTTPEGGTMMRRTNSSSHYMVSVGGEYLVSERLLVSGSFWKDLSNQSGNNFMYNNFMSPGRQGMDFRATYKITPNISVTGGIRYSEGGSPFNNMYGPGYGGYHRGPFGYY
ncbi:hypothetical protein ACMA1I_10370 [Pontibacter sp. 13R65]|uniref:hypothetical protein n=1 Tax=Pontibacter sp. 13R65 TaxID=3127458 RepID=UPI00301C6505